jgi:glycosyltransferase involved in cell wall biosynthesis
MANPGFGTFNWLARIGLKFLVGPLRKWDLKTSQQPDYFIANSTHIKNDINKYYKRDSEVIFPPVDLERFAHPRKYEREGFIIVGRQTTYKKYALAIEACNKLKLPLTIVGNGPDHASLVKLAGKTIRFITDASDSDVASLLAQSAAFIFTPIEDFGIAPIEALASGTPVLAFKAGGALDYIEPGKNGDFFGEQTVVSLVEALKKFDPKKYNINDIRSSAKRFSSRNFQIAMLKFLDQKLQNRP